MQAFGGLISPYVRKVCLVATLKDIPYELVLASPHNALPDFVAASPFGKIPAIKDGDFSLCDSTAIIAYLEAKYPANPVIPADPQTRGRTIWFDEFADTIHQPVALRNQGFRGRDMGNQSFRSQHEGVEILDAAQRIGRSAASAPGPGSHRAWGLLSEVVPERFPAGFPAGLDVSLMGGAGFEPATSTV